MNDQLFNSGKILLDITALLAFPINDLSKKEVCLPTKKSLLKKEGNSVCHVYRPRPKDFVSIIELCQRHISADPYTYLLYPYIHYFLSLSSCLNYCIYEGSRTVKTACPSLSFCDGHTRWMMMVVKSKLCHWTFKWLIVGTPTATQMMMSDF